MIMDRIYGFSPSAKEFYWVEDKELYIKYGNWNDDVVGISDEVWRTYSSFPPSGKVLGADLNGMPCWHDAPEETGDHAYYENDFKKQALLERADAEIRRLSIVNEVCELTDTEKQSFAAWKKHLVDVYRCDAKQNGPVDWPVPPDSN